VRKRALHFRRRVNLSELGSDPQRDGRDSLRDRTVKKDAVHAALLQRAMTLTPPPGSKARATGEGE